MFFGGGFSQGRVFNAFEGIDMEQRAPEQFGRAIRGISAWTTGIKANRSASKNGMRL